MSGLRVSNLRGVTAGSAPTFPDGVVVTGVSTATTFDGNLTGNVTGNVVGNVTGDVTGNVNVTGDATFTGDVSIGGTLTYQDVTNVDSVGVVTARGGIKVGAGQSISAVSGIITYYGDGSQLTGVESGVSNFVASGNIANGKTVVVNTDGTVGIVTTTPTSTPSVGTPVVFETDNCYYDWVSVAYDSANNRVVVAYFDDVGSSQGKAVVGTVSGTSITFGTPVVFNNAYTRYINAVFDSNSDKVVIVYQNAASGNSEKGTAIVGTVSGTSISFGSAVVFDSGGYTQKIGATFDASQNKVVIAYQDQGNSNYGTAIVGDVSGTSINFGSEVVFESASTDNPIPVFDSSNNKIVILYKDGGNSQYFTAIVGTVSNNSISFGTPTVYTNFEGGEQAATFDSTNNKIVTVYRGNNSNNGVVRIGTVSGTSISFGSAVEWGEYGREFGITYDSNNDKVVIAYRDQNASPQRGKVITGTVSGTSITLSTPVVFETGEVHGPALAYDSNNDKVVVAYQDDDNSDKGTAAVISNVETNLTTENYIGIAAEAISNGATGKVNIFGGTNSGQTGLTTAQTYYVQNDGSLSTTAGNPSVVAGTSISSTKIIVKG